MKHAIEAAASSSPVQSERLREWLQLQDEVLMHQASVTAGSAGLKELAAEYVQTGSHLLAARAKFSLAQLNVGDSKLCEALLSEALEHLEQLGPLTAPTTQQLESVVLSRYMWFLNLKGALSSDNPENARVAALHKKVETYDIQRDPILILQTNHMGEMASSAKNLPGLFGDAPPTAGDKLEHLVFMRDVFGPLLRQKVDQSVGARRGTCL